MDARIISRCDVSGKGWVMFMSGCLQKVSRDAVLLPTMYPRRYG
jgi:hypothetical protein